MSKLNIYDVANGNNNTNRNTNTTYFKKDNYNDNTVNCKIRTSKKSYTGVSGFISFAYNPRLVNLVKCAPERWWNATTKEWEVPDNYLDKILENIEKAGFTVLKVDERSPEDIYNIQSFKSQIEIPSDYTFKTKPWGEFQLDGVIRGINEDKFILGDDQGCGKSWQALQIACIRKKMKGIKHCLVICCVNPNKYNWMDEVEEHTFEKGYILGTRYRKKSGKAYIGSNEDKLADLENMNDCFFQITNIETLRYTKNIKVTTKHGAVKNKTIYPIADKLEELIDKGEIGYIIVDEVHTCLDKNTILKSDMGDITISDLVNNEIYHNAKVLSYNETDCVFEYIKPISWFKNPKTEKLIKLYIKDNRGNIHTINCTLNHLILTRNRGYVQAQELTELDDIVCGDDYNEILPGMQQRD